MRALVASVHALVLLAVSVNWLAEAKLVNNNLHRTIDLRSQGSLISRESVSISILNEGTTPEDTYELVVDIDRVANLVYVAATERSADGPAKLVVKRGDVRSKDGVQSLLFTLEKPVPGGERTIIDINMVYKQALSPIPHELPQSERQTVMYKGNLFLASPYRTEKTKTTIKLPSTSQPQSIEAGEYTPSSQANGKVVYGPLTISLAPFTRQPLSILFESYKVGLVVSKWHREVWVSMWSTQAEVEEHVWVKHDGARLQGLFNRKEYMQNQNVRDLSIVIPRLELDLPLGAVGVYYRDEIGNVSTSNLRQEPRQSRTHLSIVPRYPLFGGWQYNWYHGYAVPATRYLNDVVSELTSISKHVLKVPMVRGLQDVLIEQLVVKLILPEGASHIQVKTPYTVDKEYNTTTYYYLDVTGRPTVVLEKTNVVDEHWQDVEVHFQYPSHAFWQRPLAMAMVAIATVLIGSVYAKSDVRLVRGKV